MFKKGELLEEEVNLILDSMVFAKKAIGSMPPRLYYLFQ